MAMLLRSTAIIICTGHILSGLQPEYVAGPFAMPDFLSCTSLLLCLTHISRFAHYPSISVSVQAVVLWDMNGRQMPVSPLAISSSVPLGLMSMG